MVSSDVSYVDLSRKERTLTVYNEVVCACPLACNLFPNVLLRYNSTCFSHSNAKKSEFSSKRCALDSDFHRSPTLEDWFVFYQIVHLTLYCAYSSVISISIHNPREIIINHVLASLFRKKQQQQALLHD
ncbi:hypothetical protein PROFUN_08059 [Planoprotostelium fungivorum]|uniref:Uncharacterized protein n=1 Tax=Planoprotostelium fungivorum TaxID=1890364 RepID=A0A2P6NKJ1_9EUKA|nr:hypothetical protein PROFUN_08059 [Planoprotostelium fungivorum]